MLARTRNVQGMVNFSVECVIVSMDLLEIFVSVRLQNSPFPSASSKLTLIINLARKLL